MGTNECSQPASKSSWDSQDFGDINMVLKWPMAHFHKSSRPQWVKACPHVNFVEGHVNFCGYQYVPIVGTLGCVFIDNETHESGVTKCTTGEAWSAFSWHHSSVFHR